MAKLKIKGTYIYVSGKAQVVVVQPSRKSQKRARDRVRNDFSVFDKANSQKQGVVIIRRATS